ncbi:unnamed protein product, partial [Ascophyllum nodosum]
LYPEQPFQHGITRTTTLTPCLPLRLQLPLPPRRPPRLPRPIRLHFPCRLFRLRLHRTCGPTR